MRIFKANNAQCIVNLNVLCLNFGLSAEKVFFIISAVKLGLKCYLPVPDKAAGQYGDQVHYSAA